MSDSANEPEINLSTRIALRPREAAAALGISERKFRDLLPAVPHYRDGGLVLIPVDELRAWLVDQAGIQAKAADGLAEELLRDLR